jgi:hypothetical protein
MFILCFRFPDYCLVKILLEIKAKIIDVMVFVNYKEQKIAVIWIFHDVFWFILDAFRRFSAILTVLSAYLSSYFYMIRGDNIFLA